VKAAQPPITDNKMIRYAHICMLATIGWALLNRAAILEVVALITTLLLLSYWVFSRRGLDVWHNTQAPSSQPRIVRDNTDVQLANTHTVILDQAKHIRFLEAEAKLLKEFIDNASALIIITDLEFIVQRVHGYQLTPWGIGESVIGKPVSALLRPFIPNSVYDSLSAFEQDITNMNKEAILAKYPLRNPWNLSVNEVKHIVAAEVRELQSGFVVHINKQAKHTITILDASKAAALKASLSPANDEEHAVSMEDYTATQQATGGDDTEITPATSTLSAAASTPSKKITKDISLTTQPAARKPPPDNIEPRGTSQEQLLRSVSAMGSYLETEEPD